MGGVIPDAKTEITVNTPYPHSLRSGLTSRKNPEYQVVCCPKTGIIHDPMRTSFYAPAVHRRPDGSGGVVQLGDDRELTHDGLDYAFLCQI